MIFHGLLLLDEGQKKLFHELIKVLGTIWSTLPIIYRLVTFKHLKNTTTLMKKNQNNN